MASWSHACIALAMVGVLRVVPAAGSPVEDLHFGESLYYARQGLYFEALERLDAEIAQHYGVDEPHLDSLSPYIDHAQFSVGDFELSYRMHRRAGRAIKAVIEGDVAEPVRNEATYRLARLHFHKGEPRDALRVLDGLSGEVPDAVRDDVELLRANVEMALGRPERAIEVLQDARQRGDLRGFASHNLGVAMLRDGRTEEAIRQLDRAGRVEGRDRATLAIRDKSNLLLGTLLMEASHFETAQRSLDRVRLRGPFSNRALLLAGWSSASAEAYERALVPWGILAEREATDEAVQEAMLALPYAYAQLGVHGRAAVLYGEAVDTFGAELQRVDASVESVRSGAFLEALASEEIRRDEDWVVRLRSRPEAPETFYLLALMASHEFQTALQNYLDLEDLRKKMSDWQHSLDAFEDIIALRRSYYEARLPEVDDRFRKLDAQVKLRLEQRRHLQERLQKMLIAPRPDHLATALELEAGARLADIEARLHAPGTADDAELRRRAERLRGVLTWRLETRYHERLTRAHRRLRELNEHVDALQARYESFVRTRQAATHSYVGYEGSIDSLRARAREGLDRVQELMVQQGRLLEHVAVRELEAHRERLAGYQNKARYAFADSYDRAAKAQVERGAR